MYSLLRRTTIELGLAGRFAAHVPQFRVVTFAHPQFQQELVWVMDGDVQVGLVLPDRFEGELVNHDPLAPRRGIAFPEVHHAPTQPGDRITLAQWVNGAGAYLGDGVGRTLSWDVTAERATLTVEESWPDGRTARSRRSWCVDPDFGYCVQAEDEMSFGGQESREVLQEFCNFLPRGVTDNREGTGRRYPYVLWHHPDGRVLRWNQNNMSARALGAMDHFGQRRIAGEGGFLGLFGEADYEITLEILKAEPGVTSITCPNLLDEHMLWTLIEPGQPARYYARYNLIALPPAVGEALTARAEMIDLVTDRVEEELFEFNRSRHGDYPHRAGEAFDLRFYPFELNRVTDFETPVDPASSFRDLVFPYLEGSDAPVNIVSDCGHSGRRSLRVRVEGSPLYAHAIGSTMHVTEGERYRLSAWIKTELESGQASLAGIEYLFGLGNVTGEHRVRGGDGRSDWRQVQVEFAPGPRAHALDVRFEVQGYGQAWIDEILLETIS